MPTDRVPADLASETVLAPVLRLAVLRLARRLRQQAGDITPSLLSALASVERLGPVTLGELAAVERVQPPTITKFVGRLEEQGLVEREADPRDRRMVRVRLSDGGRRHLAESRTRKDAYLADRLRALDEAERDLLGRALPLLERLAGDRP